MVRRGRSSSPKASSPVRSMKSSPPTRSVVPSRPAGTQPPAGSAPQQRAPGLLGQMAATAGGVAIGSAMGHAIGNMFSGGSAQEVASQQELPGGAAGFENMKQDSQSQPCEIEWRQFMDCTQNQNDVSFCQGFNDMLKECKARLGR